MYKKRTERHAQVPLDQRKVMRTALQNAASVAAMILTTDCMIAGLPQPKPAARSPVEALEA